MKKQEAEELFEAMLEHANIWPRGHEVQMVGRDYDGGFAYRIDNSRGARRREWWDYGVGIYDTIRDTRVEVWTAAQVDQLMTTYAEKLRGAIEHE